MVSTHNMMISTINAANRSTEENSYTSSEHSADCESAPWSACSSTDMCTPMPHMTSHPINSKRYSSASDRSLTSATHMSATSSDIESVDYHTSKFVHPTTPPTLSATGINGPSPMMHSEAHDHALYADSQAWSGANAVSSAAQPFAPDGLHAVTSDVPPSYAYNNWRSESITRAPSQRYYPSNTASVYGAGEHCRAPSYSSTDSWNSHVDVNPAFPLSSSKAMPIPHLSSNNFSRPMPSMNMFPDSHAGNLKPSNLMAAQASLEAFNLQGTPQDARTLLDSLTPLPSSYSNPQMGLGAAPLMDPQTLLAYNAAFGASPLLYLYGLTPELVAARTNTLNQLATAAASSSFPGASTSSVVDDGPSAGNKKTNLYKTELCRSWEEKGTCRYGSKCQFAHGQDELKNVNRHPKFKTEVCRTFWLHGSCPYGKRCCFLHTTSTEGGAPSSHDTRQNKQGSKSTRNAHDPPTSRLQQRVSANALSVTSPSEKSQGTSSTSPRLQSAPIARSVSDMSHSRSNSSSSCSLSSDGSSHIDSLRIQIWPRFGARDQVPPQDAPGPRSRLQRLRPTEDYNDSPSSLPSTSTLSTTRYSPFVDRHQPPHSAFSDISSILARSPSHQIGKAHSATGVAEAQWPLSRLPSSANTKV